MEKQRYNETLWFLRFVTGGHMIGSYWVPVWCGEGVPDEMSMPAHGTLVGNIPVLHACGCMKPRGRGHMDFP